MLSYAKKIGPIKYSVFEIWPMVGRDFAKKWVKFSGFGSKISKLSLIRIIAPHDLKSRVQKKFCKSDHCALRYGQKPDMGMGYGWGGDSVPTFAHPPPGGGMNFSKIGKKGVHFRCSRTFFEKVVYFS